jgi:hypothetical protein
MSQQECVDKLCKKHVKTYRKKMDAAEKKFRKSLKEKHKELEVVRDILKNPNRFTKKQLLKLKEKEKYYNMWISDSKVNVSKKVKEKREKLRLNECLREYCNPTCKGTYYDESIKKNYIDPKDRIKDGFHEKLSTSDINKMKKMGAISGCIPSFDPVSLE